MVFVAYLGSGFVFSGGISRWIIFVVGMSAAFVLSLFDVARNYWISLLSSAHPIRALCIYRNDAQQNTIDRAFIGKHYRLIWLPASQRHGYEDYDSYDVIIMIGDYTDEQLQDAFDQVRL
jgi:hypothetical protein